MPAFATEEDELEWWAKERGRRLQPAKFVVAHLPWPGMPNDGTEVQWEHDSKGRKLWPLAVTLNHFTLEAREVYEKTGLAPREIATETPHEHAAQQPSKVTETKVMRLKGERAGGNVGRF